MNFTQILSPEVIQWVVPILIFFARVTDVSLGTIRIIAISREKKLLASIMGFFEVFVWILVIGQILNNLNGIVHYLAYAFGYATGNYVGLILEHKLSMGVVVVRVFTRKPPRKKKTNNPEESSPGPIDIITAPVAPMAPENQPVEMGEKNTVPLASEQATVSTDDSIARALREDGFGVTRLNARGEFGPVSILLTVVKRKKLAQVVAKVKAVNPNAFYTVEDIRAVENEDTRLNYGPKPEPIYWRFMRSK